MRRRFNKNRAGERKRRKEKMRKNRDRERKKKEQETVKMITGWSKMVNQEGGR